MAPTEILARQHYQNLTRYLFPLGIRVELLLGSMTAKEKEAEARRLPVEVEAAEVVEGASSHLDQREY